MVSFFKNLGGKKSEGDSSTAPKTKKSKDYFLELDETGSVKSEAPAQKAEPVKAEAAKAQPEPKAQQPEPVKMTVASPAPQAAPAATPTTAASNSKVEPQPGLTFSPNNLLPLTTQNSRRRPGPCMSSFLDMARQMKTPGK